MHAVLLQPRHAVVCLVMASLPTFTRHTAASLHALSHGSYCSCIATVSWLGPGSCPAQHRPQALKPAPQLCTQLPDVEALDQLQGTLVGRHVVRRCTVTCCAETRCTSMLPINEKQCNGSPSSKLDVLCPLGVGCERVWAWAPGARVCAWHRGLAHQRVDQLDRLRKVWGQCGLWRHTIRARCSQHTGRARPPCCAQLDHTHVSGQVLLGALIYQQRSSAALAQRSSSHASLLLRLL